MANPNDFSRNGDRMPPSPSSRSRSSSSSDFQSQFLTDPRFFGLSLIENNYGHPVESSQLSNPQANPLISLLAGRHLLQGGIPNTHLTVPLPGVGNNPNEEYHIFISDTRQPPIPSESSSGSLSGEEYDSDESSIPLLSPIPQRQSLPLFFPLAEEMPTDYGTQVDLDDDEMIPLDETSDSEMADDEDDGYYSDTYQHQDQAPPRSPRHQIYYGPYAPLGELDRFGLEYLRTHRDGPPHGRHNAAPQRHRFPTSPISRRSSRSNSLPSVDGDDHWPRGYIR
ncbi:MAG: hypothetical protein M1834_003525 [Cirrosporium novae-zelandiae]|nr:MAG: hypothetical protein M1834_003525 [Cirrosporium novae-zelandiae]